MGDVPKSSFLFSRGSLVRRNSEKHVLPSDVRPAPIRRGASGRKFRHGAGFGGTGRRHSLVRFLLRSGSSPRLLVLGLLTLVLFPALYFFESADYRLKEADSHHLSEAQRPAVDVSSGSHPQLPVKEQHQYYQEHQPERKQWQQQQTAEHALKEADSRHTAEPQRLGVDASPKSHQHPGPTVTEHHPHNQQHQQEHQPEQIQQLQQESGDNLQEKEAGEQATKRTTAHTIPPWKPPLLPVEVFRDVPVEECLSNPLWGRTVYPSDYEFGCDEIESPESAVDAIFGREGINVVESFLERNKVMLDGDMTLIGSGMIRDVYLVEQGGRKLVLKVLREDYEQLASESWVANIHRWEAAALDAVRDHPHIVGLLGLCQSSSVSEYFETRLEDLVLKPGAKQLPIALVVSMALDAARGLQALHEVAGGAIIHFDIKPQQMMLDAEGRLKINDLNMCKFVDADADGNSCALASPASNPGPFRSPENIAGEPLTEKLDVYSLAMTFYTMLSLHPPYTGELGAQERILNGIPPSVDPSWHPGFVEIMRDMWQRDPKARPSARRVAERLEILQIQMMLEATKR